MTLIVISILIAFTLDRWWDSARQRAEERRYLDALYQEFAGNRATLQESVGRLATLDSAIVQLLRLIGPEPTFGDADSLAALFDNSFRYAVLQLPAGSLQSLLESGNLGLISNDQLKVRLAAWPASVAQATSDGELLVQNREEILRHLDTLMPTLAIARRRSDRPPTKFPLPVAAVLSDRRVEGLLGNREIRLFNVMRDHRRLIASADTIIALIGRERR